MKNNTYNFEGKLQKMNDHELIDRFNQEVGNQGWGNARAAFLYALRNEFLSRDIDASKIMTPGMILLVFIVLTDTLKIHNFMKSVS